MSINEFGKGPGEFRVVGPPGTGKTEAAKDIAKDSATEYGFDKVLITSFSRSAAATIAARADIPEENVGTLHHFGKRLLEKGQKLYDSGDFLKKFNAKYPHYAITPGRRNIDNDDGGSFGGDDEGGGELMGKREILMGNLTPEEVWPERVLHFHMAWEGAKQEAGVIDFQDMMTAAYETECAPENPKVIIVDEAQDFSRQQVEIVRRWGKYAEQIYFIGDDDQVLYDWRGASSDAMMLPVLEDWRYRYLSQSYRVPRQVHSSAMAWIGQINPAHRLHKDYKPRDFEGSARAVGYASYKNPGRLVEDALDHISEGRDVMFIASCRNMLLPLTNVLRRNGIAYGNKYVPKNYGWNPLRNDTALMKGVLAFLCGVTHPKGFPDPKGWNVSCLKALAKCLKDKGVNHWEQSLIGDDGKDLPDNALVTERTLQFVFSEEKLTELYDALDLASTGEGWPLGFFRNNLAAEHTDKKKVASAIGKFEYIENVIERSKAQALVEPPRITVGTIHSVKGGEADVVYLFPDLSKPQKEDWDGWNGVGEFGKENLIRLFYVAMTRAKQHLVVAASDSKSWGTADLWRYMDPQHG